MIIAHGYRDNDLKNIFCVKELQGQPFQCFYSNQIKGSEDYSPILSTGDCTVVSGNQTDEYMFKVIDRNCGLWPWMLR